MVPALPVLIQRIMKYEIADRLLELNRLFYAEQAASFSATRQRIQPGMARSLSEWIAPRGGFSTSSGLHLLDVGCGNGSLAAWLVEQGYQGWCTGVDQSDGLLGRVPTGSDRITFQTADLSKPDWLVDLPTQPFDLVTCFAVLHHIPGEGLRLRLLRELKRLLAPDGIFIHSVWQINNAPRLLKRVQPWESAGLTAADVDDGDVLLDWRADGEASGQAVRYIHIYNEAELQRLAEKSSFRINQSWYSDGKEGNLGLYQVWSRA
jgi:tRNA (uracil-5-)-methyltransferase TRM9